MRIAVDARLLSAPRAGSAYYLLHLLRALAHHASQHEYQLLVSAAEIEEMLGSPGRFSFAVCSDAPLGDVFWEQVRLPRLLEELAPDMFVSPTLSLPLLRVCSQAMIVHDLGFERFPEFYAAGLRSHLKRWTRPSVEVADLVVAISDFSRQEISRLYGYSAEQIVVVPGAADERFHPRENPEAVKTLCQKLDLRQPFALMVAGMEINKNQARLIEAWAGLKGSLRKQWRLVLAGRPGGAWTRVQQTIARLGLDEEVRVLGPVADEDLPLLYNAADLFAFPSLYEGFGLPPLEAMACGVPVLASGTTALPEVVGDAAVLVQPDEVPSIAAGLGRLMSDDALRRELSQKGQQRARNFSWERSADLFLHACGQVVAADTTRSA
jgi:glycosyltransferase involved in cell wall biosynthesis